MQNSTVNSSQNRGVNGSQVSNNVILEVQIAFASNFLILRLSKSKTNIKMISDHEIDYEIFGEEMQFVEIELDPYETVVAEAGSFMMMDEAIELTTIFGDGSHKEKGIWGKVLSAGKRILTGESLFMTAFTHEVVRNEK